MIDDTRDSESQAEGADEGGLIGQVLELVGLRTDRNDAYKWVGDLKLLAFDDIDFKSASQPQLDQPMSCAQCRLQGNLPPLEGTNEARAGTTEQPLWACDNCTQPFRLAERLHCSECNGGDYDLCSPCVASGAHCNDTSHRLTRVGTICEHLIRNSCSRCILTPTFPATGTVSSFRIVRQSSLRSIGEECTHFVAVSYCWPAEPSRQSRSQYTVRDADGKVRANRAPEEILDRAVAFARESGFRFVWIDQECIDQDDAEEKAIAISSMDLVYSRATRSIALMDSVLRPEAHLSALRALYEWGQMKTQVRKMVGGPLEIEAWLQTENAVALFELLSNERWSTRAWVLQEAFSAGDKMLLLFRRPEDTLPVAGSGIFLPHISLSEVAIYMDDLSSCVGWASELYTHRAPVYARELDPDIDKYAQKHEAQISMLFRTLATQFVPPTKAEGSFSKYRIGYPKRSCNAAAALSFLRYRDNLVVSDRASIFANLCDYDYRLDMAEVSKRGHPLSACILALAFLNADYSLLIPEVYDIDEDEPAPFFIPTRAQLRRIRYFIPNPPTVAIPQAKHHFSLLKNGGVTFPGLLWKVNRRLDMAWLREIYGPSWTILSFYHRYFEQVVRGGRKVVDLVRPLVSFLEQRSPSDFDELVSIGRGILDMNDPESWKPPFDRRALDLELGALYYSILLKLILFLRFNKEFGLADAIWNSTQGPLWPVEGQLKDDEDVPVSVKDFPENPPATLNVDDMLRFDRDPRKNGWLQTWIIDRIMATGELWYGNLVRTSEDDTWVKTTYPSTPEPEGSKDAEGNAADEENALAENIASLALDQPEAEAAVAISQQASNSTEAADNDPEVEGDASAKPTRGRYFKQMVNNILIQKVMAATVEAGHKAERDIFTDDPGSYVLFMQAAQTSVEEQDLVLGTRRAFFDVGQPATIVTPFSTSMELLPRPPTRAMGASWVVIPDDEEHEGKPRVNIQGRGRVELEQVFRFVKAVRGMWAVGTYPTTRYAVSSDEAEEVTFR
ncbi:heterokaryon incompatibility protein-domain-containing protein [Lasiosphaeria hispida]|uniref:Heterokaryon incompatibility protein-domain-containing protein n=1 Tax=Lasiosphaeria hispida TaxID=260671 RepID=A0AAJ0HHM6_9PEZI|nr:heterokaryon incompatibility protein-domain-containing protein [Lasiosphaeria hispida]